MIKKKNGISKGGAIALSVLVGLIETGLIVLAAVGIIWMTEHRTQADGNKVVSDSLETKLEVIRMRINQKFLYDTTDVEYDDYILKGFVESFGDPYTVYYTAEEYKTLQESMEGTYSGIGVMVSQNVETGIITVIKAYSNGPGYAAGIRNDDIFYKVAGEECTGVDVNLVVSKIRGTAGTPVEITVYRPSENRYIDYTIIRQVVEVEEVDSRMLEGNIGYISVDSFTEVTFTQFKNAYRALVSDGAEKLIIDLRDNGGGLVTSVCDMAEMVVPAGKMIVYTEDRDGAKQTYASMTTPEITLPLVVLVNGETASASEIFTGAIKDYKLGTIIGTQTFGKGIVQGLYELTDGSALKVTISRYYTPSGVCIHGTGIEPDIEIEDDYQTEEDEQLDAAIRYLMNHAE